MTTHSTAREAVPLSDVAYPSAESIECPYPYYDRLRAEAPVHKLPGAEHQYLVSRWEDIAYVTANPDIFGVGTPPGAAPAGGYGAGQSETAGHQFGYSPAAVPSSNPPEHRLKRTFTNPIVARDHLARYEPRIRAIADELIDSFIDAGECDFMEQFASPLPIFVIGEILGFPPEDGPKIWKWTGGVGLSASFLPPAERALHEEGQRLLREYTQHELLERYERPRNDFLSEFIHAQVEHDGGVLNLPYLTNETTVMIHAGNSTTAHMLASAMMLLVQHPADLARVEQDHSQIPAVVEEVLRVESPVQWTYRYARVDTRLGGIDLPAGAQLLVMWGSANRDPERFEEPGEFRPGRPGVVRDQVAFGRGIHLCVGAPLARLEGLIAFRALFERLKNVRAAPGRNDFKPVQLVNKRAPAHVFIQFERA